MESAHIAVVALKNTDFVHHVRSVFFKIDDTWSFELSLELSTALIRFKSGNERKYTWIEKIEDTRGYKAYLFDSIEVPETVDLTQPEVYNLVNQIKTKSRPVSSPKVIGMQQHNAEIAAMEGRLKNADERYKKLYADHEKAFQKLFDRGKEINTLNEGMEKMASENERLQKKIQALEAAQSDGNIARLTAARIDAEKKLEAVFDLLERFKPKQAK